MESPAQYVGLEKHRSRASWRCEHKASKLAIARHMIPGIVPGTSAGATLSPFQGGAISGNRPQRNDKGSFNMGVQLRYVHFCACIDHSSPRPMNNLSRTVADQRVTSCLGLWANPTTEQAPHSSLRPSPYTLLPGLLLLVPPAPARLKRSKPPKPSSHHGPPRASHTRERDPTAPPPSAHRSSLPRLASNLREEQAMG